MDTDEVFRIQNSNRHVYQQSYTVQLRILLVSHIGFAAYLVSLPTPSVHQPPESGFPHDINRVEQRLDNLLSYSAIAQAALAEIKQIRRHQRELFTQRLAQEAM
jgi:hypothetical protein